MQKLVITIDLDFLGSPVDEVGLTEEVRDAVERVVRLVGIGCGVDIQSEITDAKATVQV